MVERVEGPEVNDLAIGVVDCRQQGFLLSPICPRSCLEAVVDVVDLADLVRAGVVLCELDLLLSIRLDPAQRPPQSHGRHDNGEERREHHRVVHRRVYEARLLRSDGQDEREFAPSTPSKTQHAELCAVQRLGKQTHAHLRHDACEEDASLLPDNSIGKVLDWDREPNTTGKEEAHEECGNAFHLPVPGVVHVLVRAEAEASQECAKQVRGARPLAEGHQTKGNRKHEA
mmetsp:Transcript_92430/g.275712  ORF Transcript_92430/g.275712 Transcript_92430/m.275712 type:complete len:229 (-) Transcript_92430:394-1080(-)